MATFNALDELLPGPPTPTPTTASASRPRGRALGSRRTGAFNVLDELLPGPAPAPVEPEPVVRQEPSSRMGAFNALDDLFGGTPPPKRPARAAPAKVRTTFRVSREVLTAMREAVGELSGSGDRVTIDEVAERALQAELRRLVGGRRRGARRSRRSVS
jgi:hypothetical protein